jgi:hypothetical protein
MNLFLTLLASWVIAGFIIQMVVRLLLRTRISNCVAIGNEADYVKGYVAGVTNVKMYYYSQGEIPDTQWLDKVKFHVLNERDKLEETL